MVEVYAPSKGYEAPARSGLWGTIQICAALCTASLPTYRNLSTTTLNPWPSLQNWYSVLSTRNSRSRKFSSDEATANASDSRLEASLKLDGYDSRAGAFTSVSEVTRDDVNGSTGDIPLNNIAVKHTVSVV